MVIIDNISMRPRAVEQGHGGGTDETGSITIVLDDDATARDVVVAAAWRRLSPAQVGPAVVAADTDAARRFITATIAAPTTPSPTSPSRSDGMGGAGGYRDQSGNRDRDRWWPIANPAVGGPRPLTALAEAVLTATDDLDAVIGAPPGRAGAGSPPDVVGIGAGAAVRITMTRGRITECTIDQAWLRQQDEVTLAHALREAIGQAAAADRAARQPFRDHQRRLAGIVAEARAALDELGRGARP
jgi:hypothetical protein